MRIPYSVRGRSVTASPLLFALVAFGMMVWLVHVWAITLDYLSTGAAPSFVLHMTFTALTVWISLALMLKREVAIGPNQQITVDDRLFGLLIKRRRLQVQPDQTIKADLFAQSRYLFVVAGPDQSLQLITYERVDSMMAMDLVVLFEHLGTPKKELVTC